MPPKYSGYDYIYRARRPGLVRRSLSGGGFGAKRRPPTKKVLSYAVVVFVALFSAASIAGIGLFAYFAAQLPDPEKIIARSVPETTTIYDRTGKNILYQVHSGQKRTVVELDDIAPVMRQATVAIEDKRFYTDRAIDIRGIMRSVLQNIVAGRKVQGGSTITQQFIKNSILTKEKTYTRKIKELVLAYELERRFTKDQILKFYLNEIPYDSVAFGVESASQAFFGKAAKDLTLAESAMLAAVPKATTYYSPYGNHRKELTERVHLVLDLMVEQGYIGAEQAAEAKKDDVVARVLPRRESITAPHFVFYVKDALADIFGEQEVERAGLKVITTLDMTKQTLAEKILEENKDALKKWKASTAALAAIDPKTGEILTMVGSADYFDDAINGKYNALLGRLQPGSSIKPIVYAASFEKGYTPDTVLDDVATVFKSVPKDYTPSNYDGKEHGLVTARQALAGSLNIPAVKMLYLTGIDRFTDFARKLGYTTFEDKSKFGLSLVLGGAEIRPIEHIAAFSAFAQDGNLAPTKAILRVEDRDGNVLFDNTVAGAQKVFEPEIARQINSIMSDNAARAFIFGEQNYLTLGDRPVAAKTGTTNDYKDAWAIGYTPSLVTGVWVGNAKGTAMKPGADGSKVAAPIWNRFMKESLADTPIEQFTPAESVVTGKPILDGDRSALQKVRVDRTTGKLATEFTPPEEIEERGFGTPHTILFFVDKDDPRGPAPEHPENDPQFENWEKGVNEWAIKNGISTVPQPEFYDDVHTPENKPTVSFISPRDGESLTNRLPIVTVNTFSLRGVRKVAYAIDGEIIDMITLFPFAGTITIPNRITNGFHTLSARAYDDVGNAGTTEITINLTADPMPIGIQWETPKPNSTVSSFRFPQEVEFTLEDPKIIVEMTLSVLNSVGTRVTILGTVRNPTLPRFSMSWSNPPERGRYRLVLEALLTSGDVRSEEIIVTVE